jgi:hypothetical protein
MRRARARVSTGFIDSAGFLDRLLVGTDGISNAANIAGLGLLIWGVRSEAHLGLAGASLGALLLLVVSTTAWVAWIVFRTVGYRPGAFGSLVVMGIAGGALASFCGRSWSRPKRSCARA